MAKSRTLKFDVHSNKNFLILSALFLAIYIPTLIWLWDRWFARDSYYSHGILIPFVTGFLIWQKKDDLQKMAVESSRWGMTFIVAGIVVHLISALFRIYFTSGFSMLLVFFGLVLHCYGKRIFASILFPLCFLVFMVPLPLEVITKISFKMKLFAASIASVMLNNMRLPNVQQGSMLKMQHTYVIVDDVCSGLRSLISLTALGSIFAYWLNASFIKKLILFLSTIPIAILTNVARIIFLAFISEVYGAEKAKGFVHDASGFLVFALAFIMLWAMNKLLEDDKETPRER